MAKEATLTVLEITKAAIDQTPTILANEYVEPFALMVIAANDRYTPTDELALDEAADYLLNVTRDFADLFVHLQRVASGSHIADFRSSSNDAAAIFSFGFGIAHQKLEELF